jgi:hypothetical protein
MCGFLRQNLRVLLKLKTIHKFGIMQVLLPHLLFFKKDLNKFFCLGKIAVTFEKIINDLDAELRKHKDFLIDLGTKHHHYDVKCEYYKVFSISSKYLKFN